MQGAPLRVPTNQPFSNPPLSWRQPKIEPHSIFSSSTIQALTVKSWRGRCSITSPCLRASSNIPLAPPPSNSGPLPPSARPRSPESCPWIFPSTEPTAPEAEMNESLKSQRSAGTGASAASKAVDEIQTAQSICSKNREWLGRMEHLLGQGRRWPSPLHLWMNGIRQYCWIKKTLLPEPRSGVNLDTCHGDGAEMVPAGDRFEVLG